MQPSEFWRLHPTEFWWLYDAHRPVKPKYGSLHEEEMAELSASYEAALRREAEYNA